MDHLMQAISATLAGGASLMFQAAINGHTESLDPWTRRHVRDPHTRMADWASAAVTNSAAAWLGKSKLGSLGRI